MTEDLTRWTIQVSSDLETIVPDYLENRRKDVATLFGMLGRGEYDTMRMLGHRMKGSGAGYGFDAISHLGERLERASREACHAELASCVAELESYLDRIDIVYV